MSNLESFAQGWIDAFNSHDAERIAGLYADSCFMVGPPDLRLDGKDACVGYALSWLRAFPDARIEPRNTVLADPWVVMEFTFRGTHSDTLVSPAGEIPATNRAIEGRGVQVVCVENGRATEFQLYFDQVQLLTQLGLMPEQVPAHA